MLPAVALSLQDVTWTSSDLRLFHLDITWMSSDVCLFRPRASEYFSGCLPVLGFLLIYFQIIRYPYFRECDLFLSYAIYII